MAAAASRYGATLAERVRSVPTVRRNSSGSVAEVQERREVAHSLRVSLVAVSDSASVDHTRVCRVSKRQRVSHCDQRDRSSDSDAHKAIIRSPLVGDLLACRMRRAIMPPPPPFKTVLY